MNHEFGVRMKRSTAFPLFGLLMCSFVASSQQAQAQVTQLSDGGPSCEYFDVAAKLRWQHKRGDWRDAKGAEQGAVPFSEEQVQDTDKSRMVSLDVTRIVQGWLDDSFPNYGMVIHPVPGKAGGLIVFHSREADELKLRPTLMLSFADGKSDFLFAVADTFLNCSTVKPLGLEKTIKAGGDDNLVIRFDLPAGMKGRKLKEATLQLVTTSSQYGDATLGIYRLDPPGTEKPAKPQAGFAAAYPKDHGIEKDPAVIMATGFEKWNWQSDWSHINKRRTYEVVSRDDGLRFEPWEGKALRVAIPQDSTLGLDMRYNFRDKLGREPEEVYFRYYLRFADDWHPTVDGGKLPGIAGTYDTTKSGGGWGGNKSDGTNGWSMRGSFLREADKNSSFHDYVAIGNYAYHADMQDFYGEHWAWSKGALGYLKRNRWYCIEQYVKMNTPGVKDGVMRAWVDGMLAFEKTDIRYRTIDSLKIEKIWMNVYHGGTKPPGRDLHLYIDNVVIAKRYIGPMAVR
jgi:hypothetical protein